MSPLRVLQDFLATSYDRQLGVSLSDAPSADVPFFILVDERNFLSPVSGASAVAALADQEIGLITFVVDYGGGDLQRELTSALSVSSRLLTSRTDDQIDPHGPWTVRLLWLVPGKYEAVWRGAIAERRSRSGVTEEILVDVIFYATPSDLRSALSGHGLPWLLLEWRNLLRKSEGEVAIWSSANEDVLDAMSGLERVFDGEHERRLARQVGARIEEAKKAIGLEVSRDEPFQLQTVALSNFRNFSSLKLELGSGSSEVVAANVLYGPNGSGKSSIVEAISIGVTGWSKQMADFAADEDQPRNVSYSDGVLRRKNSTVPSEIRINGKAAEHEGVPSDEAMMRIEGSVLSQEASLEFVRMRASELATRALRDYSQVADDVLDFVDREARAANEEKDRLLRSLGERTTISKLDTILTRIARNVIATQLPAEPASFAKWLILFLQLEDEWRTRATTLIEKAARFSGPTRHELETRLAAVMNPPDARALEGMATRWISEWNEFSAESSLFLAKLRERPWEEWLEARCAELTLWSNSLRTRSDTFSSVSGTAKARQEGMARRDSLQKEIDELIRAGKEAKKSVDHLESISSFISDWATTHSNTCPTCGQEHREPIDQIVGRRLDDARQRRADLLSKYQEKRKEMEALQTILVQMGDESSALSKEAQAALQRLLARRFPADDLKGALASDAGLSELLNLLRDLKGLPAAPLAVDHPDQLAATFVTKLMSLTSEAKNALQLPQSWLSVANVVRSKCEQVLVSKLPSTLRVAWLELVWSLTSARWIVCADPSLELSSQRKARKLSVIGDINDHHVLAKYLYNLSECHILGLSWFLTRYVTTGRFRNAFMVLDDPAQEMDETTYSVFVRLIGVLTRIHRVRKIPLTLVALMHQEERALELARRTDATLHMLSWSRVQGSEGAESPRRVRLFQEGVGVPSIATLFQEVAHS